MRLFRVSTMKGPALLVLLLATGLILGACSQQENPAMEGPPADQGAQTDDSEEEAVDFGEAGNPADADRTIEIEMLDSLRFEPETVDVQVGETITFALTNSGEIVHEFLIGDEEYQQEHAEEMAEMNGGTMGHGDRPNGIELDPGETGELTWTFTEEGELLYGCHEPGHYEGGMVGTINVSS